MGCTAAGEDHGIHPIAFDNRQFDISLEWRRRDALP
jgi:hypothetical protein